MFNDRLRLMMLQGLPASGKTTYAKELAAKGWVRVNKDDLRAMLHDSKWSQNNEKAVLAGRDLIIRAALTAKRNVVVDDTNFAPKHEATLRALAKEYHADFEIRSFDTDVEECITRDLKRANSVGERVIRQMYRRYVNPPKQRPVSNLPRAAIFDIDGTLAIMGNRSPYDWPKVGEDKRNPEVIELLYMMLEGGFAILLFSGRDSVCRPQTEKWLEENALPDSLLFMRPEGDTRKDVEVKREFYEEASKRYDIVYAVDDRLQVCRLWHELGLCLLRVGDPDADF